LAIQSQHGCLHFFRPEADFLAKKIVLRNYFLAGTDMGAPNTKPTPYRPTIGLIPTTNERGLQSQSRHQPAHRQRAPNRRYCECVWWAVTTKVLSYDSAVDQIFDDRISALESWARSSATARDLLDR
jgi:hypothetical protein